MNPLLRLADRIERIVSTNFARDEIGLQPIGFALADELRRLAMTQKETR